MVDFSRVLAVELLRHIINSKVASPNPIPNPDALLLSFNPHPNPTALLSFNPNPNPTSLLLSFFLLLST